MEEGLKKVLRVLIVEDDDQDARLTQRGLRQVSAVEAKRATNGQEALEMLGQHLFDLILVDLHMPKMGGLELLKNTGHVPTTKLVLTSLGSDLEHSEAISNGAERVLVKPVDPREYCALITAEVNEHLQTHAA